MDYNIIRRIGIGLGFIGILIFQYTLYTRVVKEKRQLENTINGIYENTLTYRKYNDSINIVQTKTIESNINTLKTVFKDITEDFEASTGKSIKNLQSALKTQINSKETFYIPYKDSLLKDGTLIKPFVYEDQFNVIDGLILQDSIKLDIEHRLFLTKYTYKIRNKAPWYKPWKWGKRSVVDMRSTNPKDSIIQLQEINIVK